MSELKLLPCPFCGKPGEIEKIEDDCFGVGCGHCDYQVMAGIVGIGWFSSAENAAQYWNLRRTQPEAAKPAQDLGAAILATCTCPSGDGSLRWPCPQHTQLPVAITDKTGPNGIKWYVEPNLPDGINLYIKDSK